MTKYTRLIIITTIAILAGSCANHSEPVKVNADLAKWNLSANVRVMISSSYSIDPARFGGEPQLTGRTVDSFDRNGNALARYSYNADGSLYSRSEYRSDSGRSRIQNEYDGNGRLTCKTIGKLDDSGIVTEYDVYRGGDSLDSKTIYKREAGGKMVTSATYNKGGSLRRTSVMRLDEKGDPMEQTSFAADGSLSGKTIFKIEGNGDEKMSEYDKDGTLIEESILKNNGNHKLKCIDVRRPAASDLPEETTYEYDAKGSCIKETEYHVKPGNERIPYEVEKREIAYY